MPRHGGTRDLARRVRASHFEICRTFPRLKFEPPSFDHRNANRHDGTFKAHHQEHLLGQDVTTPHSLRTHTRREWQDSRHSCGGIRFRRAPAPSPPVSTLLRLYENCGALECELGCWRRRLSFSPEIVAAEAFNGCKHAQFLVHSRCCQLSFSHNTSCAPPKGIILSWIEPLIDELLRCNFCSECRYAAILYLKYNFPPGLF